MLRLVPWSRPRDAHPAIMDEVSWNYSLFVAVLEQVPDDDPYRWLKETIAPTRGFHRLRVQIIYRSAAIKDLVERNNLSRLPLFKDERGEAAAKRALESHDTRVAESPLEVMAIAWPVYIGAQVATQMRLARIVDLRLDNLEAGVEAMGRPEELKQVHAGILAALDQAHNRVLWLLGYDTGEVVIAAPGGPPNKPKDKPKAPNPSTWR